MFKHIDLEHDFKDLSEYLAKSKEQVCYGVAKSQKQLFISKGAIDETNHRLITYTGTDPRLPKVEMDLAALSTAEKKEFYRAYGSHYFNSYFIPLRTPAGVYDFTKCFDSECEWTKNMDFFEGLKDLIVQAPFQVLGRVFLIYTPPFGKEIFHIDYWPQELGSFWDGRRHFLWLSSDKHLLLGDEKLDMKAGMFNFEIPHSTPASEISTFSLRIEGQFQEDLCKKNNITWRQR